MQFEEEREEQGQADAIAGGGGGSSVYFVNLSEVELGLVLEFVESDMLVLCTEVCRFLGTALRNGALIHA